MACLECGLEQAVADAEICARCGAALPGAGSWAGIFTGPGGVELRANGNGIYFFGEHTASRRLISWDEIGWFREGWEDPGWMLQIVLAGGRVEKVRGTWTTRQGPPELLALIRRAAAAHSVPAVLTGEKVHAGLPGKNAGLYHNPAGEPGLREWTGTEWSPFLQVDPGASGHQGQEAGLARIWSPLSPAELHRQSRAILKDVRFTMVFVSGCMAFLSLVLVVIAVLRASGHLDHTSVAAAWVGGVWLLLLPVLVPAVWDARKRKRIALALSAAATQTLAQDDPPAPIEPPDFAH